MRGPSDVAFLDVGDEIILGAAAQDRFLVPLLTPLPLALGKRTESPCSTLFILHQSHVPLCMIDTCVIALLGCLRPLQELESTTTFLDSR